MFNIICKSQERGIEDFARRVTVTMCTCVGYSYNKSEKKKRLSYGLALRGGVWPTRFRCSIIIAILYSFSFRHISTQMRLTVSAKFYAGKAVGSTLVCKCVFTARFDSR